jgi:hypothetical protein
MKKYNVNLTKRYEVEFIKDDVVYKKGDKAQMNMCLASKLYNEGRINIPNKLREDAEELGCGELFKKRIKSETV